MFELPSHPTIAVLGAGAVGGYYGARLAQAGHNVHFLLRSDYDHIRAHGLTIKSIDGDFSLAPSKLHVYQRATDMPTSDLIVIALKSTDNNALLTLMPSQLHERTILLTLQNGLGNENFLAAHFPNHPILGGVAFTCINRLSPGVIHHSDHGLIRVGLFRSTSSKSILRNVASLFSRSNIPTDITDDLLLTRWTKLAWNIPFNGLGALLDLTTDKLLDTPHTLRLVHQLIFEVMTIARADGHPLPPDMPDRQVALTRTMGPYVTSTQLDRRQNRPLELESIFLHPLAIARSHAIATPRLEFLADCLGTLSFNQS